MKIAVAFVLFSALICHAAEPCQTFHGRAHFYSGDGQFRIWHIGTHHEFEPDYNTHDKGASWDPIIKLLKAGDESAYAASNNDLFADFTVCPTEPFRKGAVQKAIVKRMTHVHVLPAD